MCGEAENGKEAIERVEELHPDVVILDLQMPIMNGLEAARRISRFAPNTAMVMFTMYESEQLWRDAQAVGIKGLVSKSDGILDNLLPMLRNICVGA